MTGQKNYLDFTVNFDLPVNNDASYDSTEQVMRMLELEIQSCASIQSLTGPSIDRVFLLVPVQCTRSCPFFINML